MVKLHITSSLSYSILFQSSPMAAHKGYDDTPYATEHTRLVTCTYMYDACNMTLKFIKTFAGPILGCSQHHVCTVFLISGIHAI